MVTFGGRQLARILVSDGVVFEDLKNFEAGGALEGWRWKAYPSLGRCMAR